MKLHHFLSVVPKAVRIAACVVVCCAVLIGVVVGITQLSAKTAGAPALGGIAGTGIGLLFGSLVAIWILCLGYVYADARRRAMPPILWTLIAALIPNLLGFLLYFALRRPVMLPCPGCGRPIAVEQRFCSWCGCEKSSAPSAPARAAQ